MISTSSRSTLAGQLSARPTPRWSAFRAALQRAPSLRIGVMVLLLVVVAGLAGRLVVQDPNQQDIRHRLESPSWDHPFGLDDFGRDILARMVHGTGVTLFAGASISLLASLAGLVIGLTAGYFRRIDNLIMRIMDGLMAFPGIVLALGLVAALGARISNIIIALTVIYTPSVTRLIRSAVLSLRDQEFVIAARAAGANEWRLVVRHIMPNVMAPFILQVSLLFGYAIIAESGLSFLGVGAPPEQPSWGTILSSARQYVYQAPFMTIIPGLAIFITVLGLNFLGDGLQDALDPELRHRASASPGD